MALAGEEKEMRMPGYHHSLDQNTDQGGGNHVQLPPNIQDHEKPTGGGATPPYNPTAGGGGGGGGGSSKFFNKVTTPRARYRECLKNHAANIGGNVTDGCGEFMPSGEEGTLEALKCAACNCHRNFHRKDQPPNNVVGGGDNMNNNAGIMVVHPLQLPQPLPSPIPSLNHHHHHQHSGRSIWAAMPPQPVKMAFAGSGGGSGATDSSSEELNFNTYHHQQATSVPPQPQPPYALAKKRFRTKFSQEQKERMLEFAEKLGWRIPREDDTEVQRFCSQVGVKRQVFKVWMHNNKNPSSAKKNTLQEDQQQP